MQRLAVLFCLSLGLAGCVQTGPMSWSLQPFAPGVSRGRAIAERACMSCHMIAQGRGGRVSGVAPPFSDIGRRYDPISLERELEAIGRVGHYQMRPLPLDTDQIRDLTAYIQSVGPRQRRPDGGA